MTYVNHTSDEMNKTSTYYLRFADGYTMTRIGTLDEVIAYLDDEVQKHGNCISCNESIRYDRFTREEQLRKVW